MTEAQKAQESRQTAKREESQKRAEQRPGADSNREINDRGESTQYLGGVTHGGVQQVGEFDYEQQKADREEAAAAQVGNAHLNANDPALPTVTEEHLKADPDESDRDSDKFAEQQGDLPSNEKNQAH